MGRSLALAIYMLSASRAPMPAPPGPRPDRQTGPLIWIDAGSGGSRGSIAQLAQRLTAARPALQILVTATNPDGIDLTSDRAHIFVDRKPAESIESLNSFLDHWRPDLTVLTGDDLPPALIVECHRRQIPLLLADARMSPNGRTNWRWRRGMAASLLGRFARILAQDADSARRMKALAGSEASIDVTGRIEETTDPLKGNEAERAALAELLQTRPVWLAVACPEDEEDAVIDAHAHAMRLAHRMLLIIVPADAGRLPALADRIARKNWIVAQRAADEEPEPAVQVFLADGNAELGLWYRLAPVTYMAGTLSPSGAGRNPFEPAALGSAIVHGPHPGPYPDAYKRLSEAGAAREVADAAGLAAAVGELIAPDRAATLAHNAWAITSGGAEVADRVVQVIFELLDASRAARPAA